ncbi:MAG: hypothetical protein ACRCXL_04990, partial [Dermatophilaceae bacterium]
MRTHTPTGDSAAALARLASQVDRVEQQLVRVAAVEHDVKLHGSAITRLADLLSTSVHPSPHPGPQPRALPGRPGEQGEDLPPEWLTAHDPVAAAVWLLATTQWVQSVWTQYTALTACWPWHPPVVAELMACRESWRAATAEDASPDGL